MGFPSAKKEACTRRFMETRSAVCSSVGIFAVSRSCLPLVRLILACWNTVTGNIKWGTTDRDFRPQFSDWSFFLWLMLIGHFFFGAF